MLASKREEPLCRYVEEHDCKMIVWLQWNETLSTLGKMWAQKQTMKSMQEKKMT